MSDDEVGRRDEEVADPLEGGSNGVVDFTHASLRDYLEGNR